MVCHKLGTLERRVSNLTNKSGGRASERFGGAVQVALAKVPSRNAQLAEACLISPIDRKVKAKFISIDVAWAQTIGRAFRLNVPIGDGFCLAT